MKNWIAYGVPFLIINFPICLGWSFFKMLMITCSFTAGVSQIHKISYNKYYNNISLSAAKIAGILRRQTDVHDRLTFLFFNAGRLFLFVIHGSQET